MYEGSTQSGKRLEGEKPDHGSRRRDISWSRRLAQFTPRSSSTITLFVVVFWYKGDDGGMEAQA